jgi:hypothetical protein
MTSSNNPTQLQPTLESLPLEIQIQILGNILHIKTLHSLVHASPHFLHVYQGSHEDILTRIVYNQIAPSVLPLAATVLSQNYLRSRRHPRSLILEFLETFRQAPSPSPPHKFSLEASKQLLKTHTAVEYLVEKFLTSRLTLLSEYFPDIPFLSSQGQHITGLQGIEHTRLFRAFYHLELYGLLFYDPETSHDNITARQKTVLFLVRLTDFEVEELRCVRDFLLDQLSSFLNLLESDFISEYQKAGPPEDIKEQILDVRFTPEYDAVWYFVGEDGKRAGIQDRWMGDVLLKGARAMQRISEAGKGEREGMLGELKSLREGNDIKHALGFLPNLNRDKEKRYNFDRGIPTANPPPDTMDAPNDAYVWAVKTYSWGDPATMTNITRGGWGRRVHVQDLRAWGYAIWSNELVRDIGLMVSGQVQDDGFQMRDCRGLYGKFPILKRRKRGHKENVSAEVRTREMYEVWRAEAIQGE